MSNLASNCTASNRNNNSPNNRNNNLGFRLARSAQPILERAVTRENRKMLRGGNLPAHKYFVKNASVFFLRACGGAGTVHDENHIDKEYARIDGGTENPGYFTAKTN